MAGQAERRRSGWTSKKIAAYAARLYFLLIIFQVPLFRVPCRAGTCTTPVQVTSSQLISNNIFPPSIIKPLLYPGAIATALLSSSSFPKWDNLFAMYNLTDARSASPAVDLQRLEILAGSYFCVAGALTGLINPGRMSLFGTLLVVWGLVKEGIFGKPAAVNAVYMYPTVFLALILAFCSITYNVKKAVAGKQQPVAIAKPLKSSAKSKLK